MLAQEGIGSRVGCWLHPDPPIMEVISTLSTASSLAWPWTRQDTTCTAPCARYTVDDIEKDASVV